MTNEIIASSQAPEQLDSGEVTIYSPPPASNDPRDLLIPRTTADLGKLANVFSSSGMYAADGKPLSVAQCAAIILTGIDLGLTPSQAMRGIRVIKGQPSPSADTLVACVRKRKDVCEFIQVLESSPLICKISGKRVGDVQPTITQFTLDDAKAAQLTSSPMYSKYPEQMLYARAAVKLIRRLWPDVALGLYTPDELREGKVTEEEVGITAPPLPVPPAETLAAVEAIPAADKDVADSARALRALRLSLNGRIKALGTDEQRNYKEYAIRAFGGKHLPAVMSAEEIATANNALDELANDPFFSFTELLSAEPEGHGKS